MLFHYLETVFCKPIGKTVKVTGVKGTGCSSDYEVTDNEVCIYNANENDLIRNYKKDGDGFVITGSDETEIGL